MNKNTIVLLVACFSIASGAQADELTIERLFASPDLSGVRPVKLKLSPDGTRVTYLRGKQDDRRQQDLWEYHIADGANQLLVDSKVLVTVEEHLDDVEKARRERMRISGKGIVEYVWAPDSSSILFPQAGDLYLYVLDAVSDEAVKRLTETKEFETDAQVSEGGRYVSFIREQNLFAIDLDSGKELQLTSDGGGTTRNGMAEFIAMEEMDRDTGYWWSPDDRYIAYTQVDESPVELAKRYQIFENSFKITEERYPFAGKDNIRIKLAILEVETGKRVWVDLGQNEDIYLARVDWAPDSSTVVFQRESRDQKRLDLMAADPASGKSRIVLTETSDVWVNLHNNLKFLERSPGEFIWASERSGFQHLYRYNLSGKQLAQLTSGEWAVGELYSVDENRGVVVFDGFAHSPLEKHLFEAPLSNNGTTTVRKITTESGWHSVVMAESGGAYVDSFSSSSIPPQVSLHAADGSLLEWLVENPLDNEHPYYPYVDQHRDPEFGTIKAEDGQTLYYSMLKPYDFDPGKRYPVIVYTYGGPHGQVVTRKWGSTYHQYLQQQGYIVFSLDNRGSASRGTAFEFPIHKQMSRIEARDQKQGAEFLSSLPYVDGDRIGIYGWSYGGYMTLMTLMQAPDSFAAGVSGAPVTDWSLYDTHYTERYMSTPAANPDGYTASNVLSYVEELKSPLLIIHGMADDNVLLNNSTLLFREMQLKGVPFEIMLYPNETHGFRNPAIVIHRTNLMTSFFDRHLKPASKP